ncbi:hypothetical protein [Mycetocola zhujimingii]|uniref:Uncharacterized protein n=1 Tax=Mycetocola zhujimingii TaxID=2079792 RepID=A0A2U1TAZ4_9MICO|nr:hypothetical protein [Mycetocola zhujimingii]AWB87764.1 hypothetical protein C3E77_14925 [Mycetocola zhujimingii]PWC06046.1 hypothetical protein DF223_13520 [Mycetocola zhujimingii]
MTTNDSGEFSRESNPTSTDPLDSDANPSDDAGFGSDDGIGDGTGMGEGNGNAGQSSEDTPSE